MNPSAGNVKRFLVDTVKCLVSQAVAKYARSTHRPGTLHSEQPFSGHFATACSEVKYSLARAGTGA